MDNCVGSAERQQESNYEDARVHRDCGHGCASNRYWLATARADSQIDRGKYLITLGGCNDCHTQGVWSKN